MNTQADSDDVPEEEDQFPLLESDWEAVFVMKAVAKRLLPHPGITPAGIIGLGRALHALDRLPESTPGVSVSCGVCYRNNGESSSVDFGVDEDTIFISEGGTVNAGCGTDSKNSLHPLCL